MKKIFLIIIFINILAVIFSEGFKLIKEDKIIAYYPFNGNSNDESGNNYHGKIRGAVLCKDINEINNSAFELDGKSSVISTKLNINTNKYPVLTISIWVYPKKKIKSINHKYRQQIFSSDDGELDRSLLIQDDIWNIFVGGARWITGVKVEYDKWCNIVVIFNEKDVEFYYNNINYSYGKTPGISKSGYNIWFGDNPSPKWDEYFMGKIDNIIIYCCSLTKEEVEILYNQK